jgi:Ca-activated chloride channel family protein
MTDKSFVRGSASLKVIVLSIIFSALYFLASAQQSNFFSPKTNRILFILDASGSMKGQWQGSSKLDLSKQILIHTIDSISKINGSVEFALRVFGHQFPRSANNCKDTKLEVPFGKKNLPQVQKRLDEIKPQGQTPIEYTLIQSITDFPADSTANNSIVLITDGIETCSGDLCSIASQMEQKGIVLKPFIVGLGLSDSLKKKFECAGIFYDVQNEDMFTNVMRVVISRALNATTSQVNLLDGYGLPTETNAEMTLYDHNTGEMKYSFVHTLNAKGNPDTLIIDPKIKYDLAVHSIPSVTKTNIELVPGIHNTIAVELPRGTLELKMEQPPTNFSGVPCIIRKAGTDEILYVQDVNHSQKYITGSYDLQILTLPAIRMDNVKIENGKVTSIKIPKPGILTVSAPEPGVAAVFSITGERINKVFDYYQVSATRSINLQPGSYEVIFRPDKGKQSKKTKEHSIQITSGKTSSVKL